MPPGCDGGVTRKCHEWLVIMAGGEEKTERKLGKIAKSDQKYVKTLQKQQKNFQ